MKQNNPLVSIIIPTFNRQDLLAHTLNSVLNQSYQNWECIVVDDGSEDRTRELSGPPCRSVPGFSVPLGEPHVRKPPRRLSPGCERQRTFSTTLAI